MDTTIDEAYIRRLLQQCCGGCGVGATTEGARSHSFLVFFLAFPTSSLQPRLLLHELQTQPKRPGAEPEASPGYLAGPVDPWRANEDDEWRGELRRARSVLRRQRGGQFFTSLAADDTYSLLQVS